MNLAAMLTAFATIFFAELPDKTMLATIVLSARFRRPGAVWLGSAAALTLQMVIAVTAGQLLSLLPDRPVKLAITLLFAVGAVLLWRSSAAGGEDTIEIERSAETAGEVARLPWQRVSATVFGIVFIAEWGDLTQLATASLAAKGYPLSVFVGATLAMITVAGIGVIAGRALLRVVPERVLHRVAAIIFGALALFFLYEALTAIELTGSISV